MTHFCTNSLKYSEADILGPIPKVSILCLTYNHQEYLSHALDSFLVQKTNFAIEIVIGEDCSKDRTRAVAQDYANRYPQCIRVLTSSINLGVTENFRRCMQACRGEYIALCDGDDFWTDPYKLQIQVDYLDAHPTYIMSFHDAYACNQHGTFASVQLPIEFKRDASSLELVTARSFSTLTVCFRNVLSELPADFDSAPILDLCIWSLLGHHGAGKYQPDIRPAAYRIHPGGILSTHSDASKRNMTARTYLCLAQYYAKRHDEKISHNFLLHAALMSAATLNRWELVRLLIRLLDHLLGKPIYQLKAWALTKRKF